MANRGESAVELTDKSKDDVVFEEDVSLPPASLNAVVITATFLSALQSFNLGLAITMPNNSQPAMMELFQVDDFMWAWIVSLYCVGGAIGGLVGGPITGMLGPKKTMLANNIVWIVAGLVQALAQPGSTAGPIMLIVGRILCGIAAGITCACVPPYIVDIAPVETRGAMGIMHQMAVVAGVFIACVLGMKAVFGNASLWWLGWGCYVIPAAANFLMVMYPDSPRYLFNKGNTDAAASALRRVRGPSYDVEPELQQYSIDKKKQELEAAGQVDFGTAIKQLFGKQYGKQNVICLMLHVGMQFCGINAINYYSSSIFNTAGIDGEIATLVVQAANVVATIAAIPLVEKAGRKPLLVWGFGLMGVFLVLTCVGLNLNWLWPSAIFTTLGVMAFAVGPGPIPWLICNELLPSSVRPAGMTLIVPVNWGLAFVVGQIYPFMLTGLGTFSLLPFGVCSIAFTAYSIFFVPETKGKSMNEIEALFN